MANFTFLEKKTEYDAFSSSCIDAENIFKDSPKFCVCGARTALECAVEWVYKKDDNISAIRLHTTDWKSEPDLYERMGSDSFKKAISPRLWSEITQIRQLANKVLHENYQVSADDAMRCLNHLFDFVQWIDKNYGLNYVPRNFSRGDVPKNDSAVVKGLKYAGAAAGGFALALLAAVFAGGDKNNTLRR